MENSRETTSNQTPQRKLEKNHKTKLVSRIRKEIFNYFRLKSLFGVEYVTPEREIVALLLYVISI